MQVSCDVRPCRLIIIDVSEESISFKFRTYQFKKSLLDADPKRWWRFTGRYGVTALKICIFINTAVSISNSPTQVEILYFGRNRITLREKKN
jgi:hypothetical protein